MTRHPCPPRFVVHGLTPGEQYIFRVKAVNAVGTSENSQESDAIKVQAALSKSGAAPSRFGVPNGLSFLQEQTFVMPFRVSSEETGGGGAGNARGRGRNGEMLMKCKLKRMLLQATPVAEFLHPR